MWRDSINDKIVNVDERQRAVLSQHGKLLSFFSHTPFGEILSFQDLQHPRSETQAELSSNQLMALEMTRRCECEGGP